MLLFACQILWLDLWMSHLSLATNSVLQVDGHNATGRNTSTLQIHVCEGSHAGSNSGLVYHLIQKDDPDEGKYIDWQFIPGDRKGNGTVTIQDLPFSVPTKIQLKTLGPDGLCIAEIRFDDRAVQTGLPHWLDLPCDGPAYGESYCSNTSTFSFDQHLPSQFTKGSIGKGCQNWKILEVAGGEIAHSLSDCAASCMSMPLCSGFQYAPMSSCLHDMHEVPINCRLWNGECSEQDDVCWEQYSFKPGLPAYSPELEGAYVTFDTDGEVYGEATCTASPVVGSFAWSSANASTWTLQLSGDTLQGVSATGPIQAQVQRDGVITWKDGRRSIPQAILVKRLEAGAQPLSGHVKMRVHTCDCDQELAGVASSIAIEFRPSANSSWQYLDFKFDHGTWQEYSVPKTQIVQLKSTPNSNAWCLDQIEVDGVPAHAGLPILLQSPRHCTTKDNAVCSPDGMWTFDFQAGDDYDLNATATGCSNHGDITLKSLYVDTVARCADECRTRSECTGFQFMGYTMCASSTHDWGSCTLLKGQCEPEHNVCWDQFRRIMPQMPLPQQPGHNWVLWVAILSVSLCIGLGFLICFVCKGRRRFLTKIALGDRCSESESSSGSEDELSEDDYYESKCRDPAWAAISLQQLNELRDKAVKEFGDEYPSVTMHDVNRRILQPLCTRHRMSYAHIVNGEDLRFINVFVSHAWLENFDEFVESVNSPFVHWPVKPNIWICATALVQSTDPEVVAAQVGLGDDPSEAPFTLALAKAEKLLVVRNTSVDLYDRIWCCWELFLAIQHGLVHRPGALMVTGPTLRNASMSDVDIQSAGASNPEDKEKILSYIKRTQHGFWVINQKLTQVKYFGG